jgi:hypothetical protein
MSFCCEDLSPPANSTMRTPRTEVDLERADTIREDPMLPRVAVDKPVNTDLNPRTSYAIRQRIDPVSVDFGHLNAHRIL